MEVKAIPPDGDRAREPARTGPRKRLAGKKTCEKCMKEERKQAMPMTGEERSIKNGQECKGVR